LAQIGEALDDKYIILYEIGRGGMSRVYQARDKRLNKNWAIKEVRKQGLDPQMNAVAGNSAYVEAQILRDLDHHHIVRINDILEDEECLYVVMDYIEGESLEEIISMESAQPETQVIKWGKQLCDALHYLHTQRPPIIYRDMKPANVMVTPDGDVKLVDFGIARTYKENYTKDTTILGSHGYAPREQYGEAQTDARSDVYSLGATLFHAVTGYGPANGEEFLNYPIRRWNPNLSGGLEKIIAKCTKPNPADRYQNCDELMYDLEHYKEVDDAFLARQRAKLRTFVAMLGVAVICLVVGFAGTGMRIYTNNQDYEQNLIRAESASNPDDRIEYYLRMAEIKPTETAPWTGMINAYKMDTNFSLTEEKTLLAAVTEYLPVLREQKQYPELAFELGKLYWYYYAYGQHGENDEENSNQSTRMVNSVRWFNEVLNFGVEADPNYKISKIYHDIGAFRETINIEVTEASDGGKYKPFWDNLKELAALVSGDEDAEIVHLTVDSIVLDSIGNYARKFKADGVTEEDMRRVCDDVIADAADVDTNTDKTAELKADTLALRAGIAQDAINNAYREDGRGLKY
jgi:serine/threonine-protein kinase